MKTDIADHLVAFLLAHRGSVYRPYLARCLALWEREYGPAVAARVKSAVEARWGSSERR